MKKVSALLPFVRAAFLWSVVLYVGPVGAASIERLNLLIITTDDMSCDSVGAFQARLSGTTPHLDQLAKASLSFRHAHTVVGNCMPSRNVMWSGRYPHNNHIEGFRSITPSEKRYPVMGELLREGGWFTGIRHKVSHSTPYSPFPWGITLDTDAEGRRLDVKNASSYGESLSRGIAAARQANQPFCLMLNVADPHKPFYAEGKGGVTVPDPNVPTLVFTPDQVPVPGFLPDDPVIRKELAHYYSSVRRADDAVGAILDCLRSSGVYDQTAIVFLSDHGMPLPFAKTQLYHHSTHTPLMIRWPGVTRDGSVDDQHMVSTVDLLPTLLEMLGLPVPDGMDGHSFAPLLRGTSLPDRTIVFKEHNENSGGQRTPMRALQTKEWLYVFNPWSNGQRIMSGATAGTPTCRQMRELAKRNPDIAARVDLFDHRVPIEAYRIDNDPDAMNNLYGHREFASQIAALEKQMEEWMVRTHDPLLDVFRHRDDATFRESFMRSEEAKAAALRRGKGGVEESDSEPPPNKKGKKKKGKK